MPSFYGPLPFYIKTDCQIPTRGNSILDLILTNMSARCKPPVSLPPIGQDDHSSVLWSFNNGTTKHGLLESENYRQGDYHNKRAFGNWLAGINWSNLFRANSCDHKLNIFHTVIKTGLGCPFFSKTVKLRDSDKPWVTANLKKILKKWQRTFREGRGSQFRRLRNLANRESKRLKSTYLKRKVEELQLYPNAKKWWQCIK